MNIEYIEVRKLVKSPLNVRKTVSAAADEELKASILAHGLMQNLVAIEGKKGRYQVIAGARRLEALKALQAEGSLPDDHAVACQVIDADNAEEASLVENTVRLAMHPADQFEAFNALIEKGQTVAQVAARFGISEKLVEQRMRLARLAPELIAAYRAEDLTLDALMAFTVTDDHAKQRAVYRGLNDWQKKRASDIRDLLTEQMVEASDKLVKFVGLDTYLAAGGKTRTDLFGEDVYLENPELLNALATEKLRLAEQELKAEGWAWVRVDPQYDWQVTSGCIRLEPEAVDAPPELLEEKAAAEAEMEAIEQEWEEADADDDELLEAIQSKREDAEKRLEAIEGKLAPFAQFTPEQKQTAGCYAYVYHDGLFNIQRGLVLRESGKLADRAASANLSGTESEPEKPKGLPESLKRDLAVYRLGVAQAAIANNPGVAFDLLVFKVARNALTMQSTMDGPNVHFTREFAGSASKDARDFLKSEMEPLAEDLPAGWLEAGSEADQFLAFQQLSDYQKQALLAYSLAVTLQPKLADGKEPTAYEVALAQTGVSVADHWRPTKANYLGRVTKDHLLEIGKSLIGGENGEAWARRNADQKKGDIAAELDKAFANPDEYGMPAEQAGRFKAWLPEGMAFVEAPEAKPAKKGQKAA
jgi:ParB family transcriptional regulator, chromosome partitioning protein